MLNFKKYILPCFFLLFVTNLDAFVLGTTPTVEEQGKKESITVEQFIAMTPASMETTTGKKMGWGKKQLFKIAQKSIKKRLAKGDVELNDAAFEKIEPTYSLVSLIFGLVAFVSMFFGIVAFSSTIGVVLYLLAILFSIASIVLGITGLRRENESSIAILGIVWGAIALVPALLIIPWLIWLGLL